jgi:bifunctional DNA-binding transcriptional regulator/antitoxin component of YhaV-PrlF toxin-antitoxin module
MSQMLEIDVRGRLTLPDKLREAAHIQAPGRISVQVRPDGLLLCSRPADLPEEIAQLASLNGPIDAWDVLEGEIEAAHGGAAER